LDAGLELDDADLGVLIKRHDGDAQSVWQTCEAVGFVLVVEGVKHLDCEDMDVRQVTQMVLDMLASH
jgi:hypothetical protein